MPSRQGSTDHGEPMFMVDGVLMTKFECQQYIINRNAARRMYEEAKAKMAQSTTRPAVVYSVTDAA